MIFIVISASVVRSAKNSKRYDGIAITTKMTMGSTVQTTSNTELCVVFEGTGLAFSLKRKMQINSRARTNRVMIVTIHNSSVWKSYIICAMGLAGVCKFSCHSFGKEGVGICVPSCAMTAQERNVLETMERKPKILSVTEGLHIRP